MKTTPTHLDAPDEPTPTPATALQAAISGLLQPLAELAVARGLPFDTVQEALKMAFVQAAARAHPGLAEHRKVSRVSTTTGLNRREVTRLTQLAAAQARSGRAPGSLPASRSLASQVFTRWRSQPAYLDPRGRALVLQRLGPAPSFESLAQGVTRDVHPRGLLDELCRLKLALWNTRADTIELVPEPFVPKGDPVQLLGVLADNVGDHLRAAVANVLANVLGDDAGEVSNNSQAHFEQSVFADGLSADAITALRPAIAAQWRSLMQALVPALQDQVQAGARLRPPPAGRLRVGLYSYQESGADSGAATTAGAPPARPLPRRAVGPSDRAQAEPKPGPRTRDKPGP